MISENNNRRHAATGNLFILTLLFHWKLAESKPEHPLQKISSNPVRYRLGVHPLVPEHKWCTLMFFHPNILHNSTGVTLFQHWFQSGSQTVSRLVSGWFQTVSRLFPGRESCRSCSRSRKAARVSLSPLHTVVGWSATGSRHRTWNKSYNYLLKLSGLCRAELCVVKYLWRCKPLHSHAVGNKYSFFPRCTPWVVFLAPPPRRGYDGS